MAQENLTGNNLLTSNIVFRIALILIIVAIGIAAFFVSKKSHERELYSQFSSYLSERAETQYSQNGLLERIRISEANLDAIREVERTNWPFVVTELDSLDAEEPQFVYRLNLDTARVDGCIFSNPAQQPAGYCTHVTPRAPQYATASNFPARAYSAELQVFTADMPHIASSEPTLLQLGYSDDIEIKGDLRIDADDVEVSNASVHIQDPVRDDYQHDVPIADFSMLQTPVLQATKVWTYDMTYDMPSALAGFFDDADQLTVFRLDGGVRVDLREQTPGFIVEGRAIFLNSRISQGQINYYPGHFTSINLSHLSFPGPLPDLCFTVRDALAEIDFQESRIRLGGSMIFSSAESFSCALRGNEAMNFITKGLLTHMLETAREHLNLPSTMHIRTHAVLDWDDRIICGDLDFQGRSVLHVAYSGLDQDLFVWAPKSFRTRGVTSDSIIASAVKVGRDFGLASWGFPRTEPWKCWEGDSGPKTDLFDSILPSH